MDEVDNQALARLEEKVEKLKDGQEYIKRNLDVVRMSLDTMRIMLESYSQRFMSASSLVNNAPTLQANTMPQKVSCVKCGSVVLPRNLSRHMKLCSLSSFDINQPTTSGTGVAQTVAKAVVEDKVEESSQDDDTLSPPKRKRGRPPKQ